MLRPKTTATSLSAPVKGINLKVPVADLMRLTRARRADVT